MSDSVRPHRWQPTRHPGPWDSPGKNTGVGCHFHLQCTKVKVKSLSCVRLSATPWTAAYQAPLSTGFSRQEHWSGLPLPSLIFPLLVANSTLATGPVCYSLNKFFKHSPTAGPLYLLFPLSGMTLSLYIYIQGCNINHLQKKERQNGCLRRP